MNWRPASISEITAIEITLRLPHLCLLVSHSDSVTKDQAMGAKHIHRQF